MLADQAAHKGKSDLDPYCLQYRLARLRDNRRFMPYRTSWSANFVRVVSIAAPFACVFGGGGEAGSCIVLVLRLLISLLIVL